MKKWLLAALALSLVLMFPACAKKAAKVEPVQGPAVEQVEEPTAKVEKPVLSEEELFQQKSLEELNKDQVLKKINFDFDMYTIREDMKPILQANANWLLKFPSVEVLVEGHCDERGTNEYNMALGQRRADSAAKALKAAGVEAKRIKTVSYGEEKPVCKESVEACWSKNRNAMFFVMKP